MIRPATIDDIDEIFDRSLSMAVNKQTIINNIESISIIELVDSKMGALIFENFPDCEIHILCPKKFVRKSREMCNYIMDSFKYRGYENAYTTVADGYKTAYNLAIKLGFIPVDHINGSTILKRYLWA